MPRRKDPGGNRRKPGPKPAAGVARSIARTIKLTPDEAAAQDAAAELDVRLWSEWIRRAAELAIARGSTR